MIALTVMEEEKLASSLARGLSRMGFECVNYRDPIKALDNLEEIGPDAVIMASEDFPRHWKPLYQVIRATRDKDKCVLILIKGEHFTVEEAAKAAHIGINGIIKESDCAEGSKRLSEILRRYFPNAGRERDPGYSFTDEIDFVFTNPKSKKLIPGTVTEINVRSISFRPAMTSDTADMDEGTAIPLCTLKLKSAIGGCSCKVVANGPVMTMAWTKIAPDLEKAIRENALRTA